MWDKHLFFLYSFTNYTNNPPLVCNEGLFTLSHVRDVAAIVHIQNINNGGWGDIYLVNVGRQGIRCLLAVKNGVGVAT
jgi:hypothetical protein